jgi:hypothetical protein
MDNNDNSIETTDTENDFEARFTTVLEQDLDDERMRILREAQTLVAKFNDAKTLDTSKNAERREECFFDMNEEDVLYDAWLVLREEGWSLAELQSLTTLIEAETIYEAADIETLYRIGLCGEDEDDVLSLSDDELLSE